MALRINCCYTVPIVPDGYFISKAFYPCAPVRDTLYRNELTPRVDTPVDLVRMHIWLSVRIPL